MSAPMMLGCAAAVLLLGLPVVGGADALEAKVRVSMAADAAALAAADAFGGWISAEPCVLANEVAAELRVRVLRCDIEESRWAAQVEVGADSVFGLVRATARAGPAFIT